MVWRSTSTPFFFVKCTDEKNSKAFGTFAIPKGPEFVRVDPQRQETQLRRFDTHATQNGHIMSVDHMYESTERENPAVTNRSIELIMQMSSEGS